MLGITPLGRYISLYLDERGLELLQLIFVDGHKATEKVVVENRVDTTPAFLREVWNIDAWRTAVGISDGRSIRQDFRQRLHESPGLFPGSAPQLESQKVHPSMKKTSIIRELVLEFIAHPTSIAQLVHIDGLEIAEESLVPDSVDSATTICTFNY